LNYDLSSGSFQWNTFNVPQPLAFRLQARQLTVPILELLPRADHLPSDLSHQALQNVSRFAAGSGFTDEAGIFGLTAHFFLVHLGDLPGV
jgi:hypothetical protein